MLLTRRFVLWLPAVPLLARWAPSAEVEIRRGWMLRADDR